MILIIATLLSLVTPKETMRFSYINEQNFDNSCGYSVVSSLLDIYWNIPTTEEDVFNNYLNIDKDKNEIKSNMFFMCEYIEKKGIKTKVFKMNIIQLNEAIKKISPIIVHYDKPYEQ
ncbi:hypothetical protein EW093_07255 [Thiospirochaeta perfilievii]|uniref:Peptidase C39 domain-containing protein n=1 Tax=Thiospirochaeta perfilievii TaxID=252967 RepID=A0A5C1Q8W3_9SPIO|nr:hypothetical protein [Thiospirochaeta perfilievii]QEN04505.1 hypothetical protein EW093_07255 [Thiospirochaeta perfilievii]